MNENDVRWEQRFSNFKKALKKLEEGAQYIKDNYIDDEELESDEELNDVMNDLIKQGIIQSFEFTHELAWNVIKDYAAYQGNPNVSGSRDASRAGFEMGLIQNGEPWMEMINSRNRTTHTYDKGTASEIFIKILNDYLPAFLSLKEKMESLNEK